MLTQAILVKRPPLPQGLRVVRCEFLAMEFDGLDKDAKKVAGWWLIVIADAHKLTADDKAQLKALGFTHFQGRNAGTFRKKVEVRFES